MLDGEVLIKGTYKMQLIFIKVGARRASEPMQFSVSPLI